MTESQQIAALANALNQVFNRCAQMIAIICDVEKSLIDGIERFLNDFEFTNCIPRISTTA